MESGNDRIGSMRVAGLTTEGVGGWCHSCKHVPGGLYTGRKRSQAVPTFEDGHHATATELIGHTTEHLKETLIPGHRQAASPDGIIPVCIETSRNKDALRAEAVERGHHNLLVDPLHGRVTGMRRHRNIECAPVPCAHAHFIQLTTEWIEG